MKTDLPSLEEDLTAVRRRLDLKAIRPKAGDDEQIAENSRRLGSQWGAQTTLEPNRARTPLASLRIEVPEYVDHELAVKAAQERVTKQFLVLQALKRDGFKVEDVDLVADKRKAKR